MIFLDVTCGIEEFINILSYVATLEYFVALVWITLRGVGREHDYLTRERRKTK